MRYSWRNGSRYLARGGIQIGGKTQEHQRLNRLLKPQFIVRFKVYMRAITANDLKSKGVSILEDALESQDEAIISVRGKPRFVVMDIDHYERLREAEIHLAWQEARAAIGGGDYVEATAEERIACLRKELDENAL